MSLFEEATVDSQVTNPLSTVIDLQNVKFSVSDSNISQNLQVFKVDIDPLLQSEMPWLLKMNSFGPSVNGSPTNMDQHRSVRGGWVSSFEFNSRKWNNLSDDELII